MARDSFAQRRWIFAPEEDPIAKSVIESSPLYQGLGLADDFEAIPEGTGERLALPLDPLEYGSETPAAVDRSVEADAAARADAIRRRRLAEEARQADIASLPIVDRIRAQAEERDRLGGGGVSVGELVRGGADAVGSAAEAGYNLFGGDPQEAYGFGRVIPGQIDRYLDLADRFDLGLLDADYSPTSLASGFVPFLDEATGAYSAATTDETYSDAQRRYQAMTDEARERYPGSAIVGGVGQGIVASPFLRVPAALRAPLAADASALRIMGQAGGRGLVEGGELGALLAADRSSARPLAEAIEVARGRVSPELGAGQVGRELLTFAGDVARGTRDAALVGGAVGSGLGAVQAGIRNAAVRPSDIARGASDEAAAIQRAIESSDAVPDEYMLDLQQSALSDESLPLSFTRALDDPDQLMGAALPEDVRSPNAAMLAPEEALTPQTALGLNRPDAFRLRAMGLQTVPQLRGAANVFGLRGLSRRADMYGILREGELAPVEETIRRATALRERAGGYLRGIAQQAERDGVMIDGDALADEMQALAQRHRAIRDPSHQAIADDLERQIQTLRPEMTPGDVIDVVDDFVASPNPTIVERVPLGEEMGRATLRDTMPLGQRVARDARRAMNAPTVAEASPYGQRLGDVMDLPEAEGVEMLPDEALPEVDPADVTDDGLFGLADEGESLALARAPRNATQLRRPTLIPWSEMQQMMAAQADRNAALYRGTATSPGTSLRVGADAYRLMNRARDRAIEARYGQRALGDYRSLRDQYATGATISPPRGEPRSAYTEPTLRRAISSAAGYAVGGPVLGPALGAVGYLAGNRLPAYEYSILAALSRPGVSLSSSGADLANQVIRRVSGNPAYAQAATAAAGEQLPMIVRIADSIGDSETAQAAAEALNLGAAIDRLPRLARDIDAIARVSPEMFGRHAPTVRTMVARGLTINDLMDLYRRDPQAAVEIEQVATDGFAEPDPETGEFDATAPEGAPVGDEGDSGNLFDVDPETGEFVDQRDEKSGRVPHLTGGR